MKSYSMFISEYHLPTVAGAANKGTTPLGISSAENLMKLRDQLNDIDPGNPDELKQAFQLIGDMAVISTWADEQTLKRLLR